MTMKSERIESEWPACVLAFSRQNQALSIWTVANVAVIKRDGRDTAYCNVFERAMTTLRGGRGSGQMLMSCSTG